MRFVKTGVIVAALACSAAIGAGVAHADQTITVTAELLTCAAQAKVDLGADAQVGKSITVSDQTVTDLKAANCL
ncbi:hypothetical protein [Nocardia terpenica]|uniref:Uncharacterized protein n=1 Tax=Nocardia terpenica TaxID=455432 RepID=A0A164HH76_9NOCA|nr:hypothetical protein [Nocardia terpenica]KZM68511.1 hypothetical protein AWN90_11630 [Nocardia terpenica]NQE88535.1 hypothetical protein [Nocardia terpenica]